jgi:translation initiation factor IF-3
MIRIPQVRVVDEEGSQLGVMATPDALGLAQERGLDLVEVAPMSSPPVTRLLDYGQFKYEQARKDKEARKHQRSVEFKEVRLRVKIGKGDFDTKVRRAIGFLELGDRVKVTVQFRGREVSHAYIGRDLLSRFAELVEDHGTVDRPPMLEGRSMSMVVTSTHKPGEKPAKTEASKAEAPAKATKAEPAPAAAAAKAEPAKAEPAKAVAKTDAEQPKKAPAAKAKTKTAAPAAAEEDSPPPATDESKTEDSGVRPATTTGD